MIDHFRCLRNDFSTHSANIEFVGSLYVSSFKRCLLWLLRNFVANPCNRRAYSYPSAIGLVLKTED